MKFQLASDIHTEFYTNQGRKIISKIAKSISKDIDGIFVPGDLGTKRGGLKYAISMLADLYENVIYTPGNHEYWGGTKHSTEELLNECSDKYSNFQYLNRSSVNINNVNIHGTTLWFPPTERAIRYRHQWSDFKQIIDSYQWIFDEFHKSKEFLLNNIKEGDVVLTHYLPCKEAIHSNWAGETSNCYFLSDVTDVILETKPKVWVYGHTHESMNFSLGKTEFFCNPVGYPDAFGKNSESFNPNLIIEI